MEPLTLRPDEEETYELAILFSRTEGFAFQEAGRYWISTKVLVIAPGEQPPYFDVEAEPVAITVREPEGPDQAVWDWLSKHGEEYGRLVQIPWMAELPESFVEKCRRLAETSDSVYAQYLALFLSRWYGEGPGKDLGKADLLGAIATMKASSDLVKTLAARNGERIAKALSREAEREALEPSRKERAERPVEPEVRQKVEAVFQSFIAAFDAGDLEGCLQLVADDYRDWSRDRQREHFQDEIDDLQNLRDEGAPGDVTARVLSVVETGTEVVITAVLSVPSASGPPEDKPVRCRLRKYGDHWLIQELTRHSQGR